MARCKHGKIHKMIYIKDCIHAEEQLKKGIKQILCPICKRWLWPDEFFPAKKKPRMVRVKAWAYIYDCHAKFVEARTQDPDRKRYCIPCTILIDRMYLKKN